MDDVIFAGTSKRPALGRAEVSLTIDNASRRLPVELAEVTITRTLFRTGESEYAMNGAPCRLLDIQELLSDAGVGRQQHVIVSQGQLDSVLQARPEDRRMVIEEAAGVLKFRRRRERAERRLESSEQNLLRLQDLQREVRRQLRPLERQAEAARRHDGLVAELRALRLHLAGRELDSLGRRLRARRAVPCRGDRGRDCAEERAGAPRRPRGLDRVCAHRGAGLGRGRPARACRAPAGAPARPCERGGRAPPHRRRRAGGGNGGGRRRLARGRVVPPRRGPRRRRGGPSRPRARARDPRAAGGRAFTRRGGF